jgi:hypothetical protein
VRTVIEALLTAAFVFSVFMLAADKHKGTVSPLCSAIENPAKSNNQFIAPIGIGLALFIAELVGASFTGCSLNPARSFGPAVVTHHFPGYHWIYWIGPLVGSFLAAAFYKVVKVLEFETSHAMRGESVLGHRRGISSSSAAPGAAYMTPRDAHGGHHLNTVLEHDLEKGPDHDTSDSAQAPGGPVPSGKQAQHVSQWLPTVPSILTDPV